MRSVRQSPEAERAVGPPGLAGPDQARPRPEELGLVEALRRGEPWAAKQVWDQHAGSVRRLMARALGPRPEVDDLTQDVFMRVFSRIGVLREASALREFVIAVSVNVLKRELRRRWVRRRVSLSDSGSVPDIEAPRADPEAREALARCYAILDKLGARERAAFVLRYMEERTLEEVATGLGVSPSTAKRLVIRSSERVSKHVGNDEGLRDFFDQRQGRAERPPPSRKPIENTSNNKSNASE
ncbi:MAG TPA: sigma-70 family RNA polymerase sigma factor [Polyangia bacterium]|nr:sigma-70 family RNA polymerase sigma factor [Polyangia bacterium]